MVMMSWKEEYSVGIDKIDDQHKKLISLLNKLYDAMKEGKGKDVMIDLLDELSRYTVYHFQTEEDLFGKYKYSNAEAHIKEHQQLKDKVGKLFEDLKSGKSAMTLEVYNFLKDWVGNHILQSDLLYAAELRSKV